MLASRPSFTEAVPSSGSVITPTPVVAPTPTPMDGLVVNVSEDAYLGDAQFVVTVDGQQIGGQQTATALHGADQTQAVSLGTVVPWSAPVWLISERRLSRRGGHRPQFLRRSRFLQRPGHPCASATLDSTGTDTFGFDAGQAPISSQTVVPLGTSPSGDTQVLTSSAVINVFEDAWMGDAQFTVAIDGQQIGGVHTATTSHAVGQSQAISLSGIAKSFQQHDIAVTFLNDAYGGTVDTDRNLYVNSVTLKYQNMPGASATLPWNGTSHFSAVAPVNWTGNT